VKADREGQATAFLPELFFQRSASSNTETRFVIETRGSYLETSYSLILGQISG
jgi:hypothetical protein